MANFENISITITANAKKAVEALDALTEALGQVNTALGNIDFSKLDGLTGATDGLNKSASELNKNGSAYRNVAKDISKASSRVNNIDKIKKSSDGVSESLKKVQNSAKKASNALNNVGSSAGQSGTSAFKKFTNTVKDIGKAVNKSTSFLDLLGKTAKGVFKFFTAPAVLAGKAIKKLGKDNSETAVTAQKLAKELLRVGKMFKLMITRMVLRQIIKGIGDGFKNLAQYSREVNASMSLLWNSFRQLGNSIASAVSPLLNAFAPALNYIIQLAIKAVNVINQLISALTGMGTWTRAKTLTDDYAKSLDKSNKSAKALKKTVLGFDELNQLQDNNSSGGGMTNPADMFEEAPIEDKWKDLAKKIKSIWNKLIAPLKKAWNALGDDVIKAWTDAFKSIGKLAKDVGNDFLEVWNDPRTQTLLRTILLIFRDIGNIVKNLADGLDEAWNKNDVGIRILRDIRDIFLVIATHVQNITEKTAEWVDELDFSPLFEAFEEWLDSLKPVVDNVLGIFEDFYTHALLPIGKWAVEEGGKELIKVFTDFNNEVEWDVIRERLDKVWNALVPFAKKVGEGLVKFIDECADATRDFLNSEAWNSFVDSLIKWTDEVDAEDVKKGLEMISSALAGYLILKGLAEVTTTITGLMTTIGSSWVVGNIIAVIAEVATTIGLLTDAITDYKKALGKASLWEALFDRSPEADAKKQAYASGKSSNPYNGNRDENAGFKWSNLLKAFTDDTPVKNARDMATEIDKMGDAFEGAYIHAVNYDNENSLLSSHLKGTADQQKGVSESFKDYALNAQTATDAIKNASNVTPKFSESQSKLNDALKMTSEKTSGAKTALDNLKSSTEKYTGVAPKLTRSQQDIMNSLKGVKIETENVSTETANAGVEISGAWQNCSINTGKSAKDIEKSVSDSMDGVNKSMQTVKDGMTEDKWTFNGVIDGFKKTFEGVKSAIAPIWNNIAEKLNGDHKVGGGFMGIHLPTFATGGFVEDGLFMMNHNELVGRFSNGRTAVANNEQITDGIARAVFNAMVSANASGGRSEYINNTIMVDGVAIARAVTKGQETLDRRYSPSMA